MSDPDGPQSEGRIDKEVEIVFSSQMNVIKLRNQLCFRVDNGCILIARLFNGNEKRRGNESCLNRQNRI